MAENQQQQQQQQWKEYKLPYELVCFEKYTNFELVNETELDYVINHVCGHLNEDYTRNYPYWYDMYCSTSKTFLVLRWKKSKNLPQIAKLGQVVCNDEIIDLRKNEHKCSCSSLYFNAVKF